MRFSYAATGRSRSSCCRGKFTCGCSRKDETMPRSPDHNLVPISTTLIAGKERGRHPAGVIMRADAATARPRQRGGRNGNERVYTRELSDEICWRLASGESLKQICKDPLMPGETTVRFWAIEDRDGFAARYAQARESLMDRWSEEIIEIADDATLEPNDRRVRTENRRWLMSKLAYRRYGDKLIHSGDPENPIAVMHRAARIGDLSPVELEALDLFTRARLTVIDAEAEPEGE
jgi:hypothetical protein